ncbi:unnamed protein product [Mytilus edulis]|uniref:CxC2-like cysteine cluster KDZ transposase-associated domain-containing protein n=1 Tax=Mytilus edulis TaxID=6550 RepID=A0A8S3VHE4_MYTED|nr:unnamed protein product [Mytilus edulis]
MEAWDLLREKLLVTRIEEFSPASYSCCFCDSQEQEIIYCQDCGPTAYYCHTCCMRIHKNILFHKPHQWKQSMYVPMLMTNELARKDHVCETSYSSTIYAVDVKGSQHVCKINLCRCEDPAVTLLRYSLWPATPTNPRISFDLRFMELLSILQLECCLPAKSFCEALEALHSNYIKKKNIYRSVVGDCLTEYNFHRSSLNTRKNITESSFSTECPICLKTPSIVSMDANFGLVHKCSSGIDQGRQSARHKNLFFLDHGDLKKFIDDYAVETKSTNSECSNFQAGSVIRSKVKNKKLDVTGIFGSVCKHDIPIYFADLAHGERLSYPVYILKCVLENRPNDHLVVMYDIACMLHKHLQKTNNKDLLEKCSFAVPVFHSFAHNTACQLTYGQRFADSTGMTDGEGIERLWSYLRGFRKITKEMTISNRQDLLTEAMLHHTEKQIWGIGNRMAEKLKKCDKVMQDNDAIISEILVEFGEPIEVIESWKGDWKSQCSKKNSKALYLNADEEYVECLKQIDSKKQLFELAETEDEKLELERCIERLSLSCTKLKKKSSFKELELSSERQQQIFQSARGKRIYSSLVKLKELATDRQYLSSLMRKYADGQAIGIRVSKQFTINLNKIKKEVENYNVVVNEENHFQMFLTPASEIFSQLDSRKLSEKQQKAVQSKSLYEHAAEEYKMILKEITDYFNYISYQSSEITRSIDNLMSQEQTRYNLGMMQYLSLKHFNIESLFNNCFRLFEDLVTDFQTVPNTVHDQLTIHMSNSTNKPYEEELEIILQEIENYENNELDGSGDNFVGDDDDVMDDGYG